MRTSKEGKVALVASEGVVPAVYLDSVGVPTYGVGVTHWAIGEEAFSRLPDEMPKDIDAAVKHALTLFDLVLEQYEDAVNAAVRVPIQQHEFDALVHFCYNVGGPNFRKSRLLKLINSHEMRKAGETGFHGWLRPPELRGRRDTESAMFLDGDYGSAPIPIYQTNNNRKLRGRLRTMSRGHVMSLLAEPGMRPLRSTLLPMVPRQVQEVAEDAGKPLRLSKTAWATASAMGLSAWQAFQAADPIVQAAALGAIALLVVVFFERFRKSKIGKAAVEALGL